MPLSESDVRLCHVNASSPVAAVLQHSAGCIYSGSAAAAGLWPAGRALGARSKPRITAPDDVVQDYHLQSPPTATQADRGSAQSS